MHSSKTDFYISQIVFAGCGVKVAKYTYLMKIFFEYENFRNQDKRR